MMAYEYTAVRTADLLAASRFGWEHVQTFNETVNNGTTGTAYVQYLTMHVVRRQADLPMAELERAARLLEDEVREARAAVRRAMHEGLAESDRLRADLTRRTSNLHARALWGAQVWFLTAWLLKLCADNGNRDNHQSRFSLLEVE